MRTLLRFYSGIRNLCGREMMGLASRTWGADLRKRPLEGLVTFLSLFAMPHMLNLRSRIRSTVVNTMLDANSNSCTSSTAFFYCARSTAEPERAKPAEIMGALLRQLASSKPDLPVKEPVAKEYEARKEKAEQDCSSLKKLTIEDCTRLIIELTQDYPATIILDALDECEENTRHELLEAFDDIISNSAEVVKVFVSSRDDIDIVSSLRENIFLVFRTGVEFCL